MKNDQLVCFEMSLDLGLDIRNFRFGEEKFRMAIVHREMQSPGDIQPYIGHMSWMPDGIGPETMVKGEAGQPTSHLRPAMRNPGKKR